MTTPSGLYKQKKRIEDPERHALSLEKRRISEQKKRDEEKRKIAEGLLSQAEMDLIEDKKRQRREKANQKNAVKRKEKERKTLNSQGHPTPSSPAVTADVAIAIASTPEQKRPCQMDPEEKRAYNAMKRREQRAKQSSQKKTAVKMKNRRRYLAAKAEKLASLLNSTTPTTTTPKPSKLPKKAHNLSHEFKSKARELGLSSEQYAQAALNLINPRTPDKRAAISRMQPHHPCRNLFPAQETGKDIEGELGIHVEDASDVVLQEATNPAHEAIREFYLREDVSRILQHARYTTKHGAARVLTVTVRALFEKFKEERPDITVGLTTFQAHRPKNVRLLGSVPVEGCLCIYCTNVRLKLNALNASLDNSARLPAEGKLLNFINCPVDKRWNSILCIDGLCNLCSDRMRPVKVFCRDILHIPAISWKTWERNGEGKLEPATKYGTMKDLLEGLRKDLEGPPKGVSFPQHLFTAYWQLDQFKRNKRNPEDGEVVMVQDFAENRKAVYAEEIKSAHFGKGQITVHPMVCFYRSGENITRHAILLFSDDIGHDYHAVNAFTMEALRIIRQHMVITKLTMWSDGAASQYKGKGTFADLSLFADLEVQRCFYGSEHGKGEADGETGVLSQILRRAAAGGQSFRHASDMVAFMQQHHAISSPWKKRQCFFSYSHTYRDYLVLNDINRERPETDVQTIPGTRRYHQFCRVGNYVVKARRLACFCTACCSGTPEECLHLETVGNFETHRLRNSCQEDVLLEEEERPAPSEKTPAGNVALQEEFNCPDVRIGDYLHIECEINRLKRTFYAVVIPSPEACLDFFVRFFRKGPGKSHVFGDVMDESIITQGPPDNYKWRIIAPEKVSIDNRGHYYFK